MYCDGTFEKCAMKNCSMTAMKSMICKSVICMEVPYDKDDMLDDMLDVMLYDTKVDVMNMESML